MLRLAAIFLLTVFLSLRLHAQVTISGTVYDISKKNAVEGVSVIANSGKGTFTDSLGHYTITVRDNDSIYFSYLNKATPKYAVNAITNTSAFDISILRKIKEFPMVTVRPRNYRMDSLQNREDYAKIFNYKKPTIQPVISDGVAGMDFDAFIKMFQFRKNARMAAFQRRLLKEEEDSYINYRFSKRLVRKLTGLEQPELDSFMMEYRPTLGMVRQFNDLELGQYVVEAYKFYKAGIKVDRKLLDRYNQQEDDQ